MGDSYLGFLSFQFQFTCGQTWFENIKKKIPDINNWSLLNYASFWVLWWFVSSHSILPGYQSPLCPVFPHRISYLPTSQLVDFLVSRLTHSITVLVIYIYIHIYICLFIFICIYMAQSYLQFQVSMWVAGLGVCHLRIGGITVTVHPCS
jgi:hypothetical protein